MWSADEIVSLCCEHYSTKLPRKGMPESGREWTLLAAVVKIKAVPEEDSASSGEKQKASKEVVALGTGTKCIGQSKMSKNGDVLNDSHAEVVARRGFLRYLCYQLLLAVRGEDSSIFTPGAEKGKWRLKPGLSFVFFTSHTPCGDASIIPMMDREDQPCQPIRAEEPRLTAAPSTPRHGNDKDHMSESEPVAMDLRLKRKPEENNAGSSIKRIKTENSLSRSSFRAKEKGNRVSESQGDSSGQALQKEEATTSEQGPVLSLTAQAEVLDVHRTGAKCVPGGRQDPHQAGAQYHSVGQLRVKPGRGDRTLSLSCSDKMARWNVLGCQGALLMHYLQGPLYFSAVITGRCPYSDEAMRRALISRCSAVESLPPGFTVSSVELQQSQVEFIHSRRLLDENHDPSKGKVTPCGAAISWCAVPDQPLDVTANGSKQGVTKKALGTPQAREKDLKTYWDFKRAAVGYQQAWQALRQQVFEAWIRSPRELLQFE
ncbi:tRNA-specific adenosine deaminase 1 isoform X2 [Acipenser ruthenus]|uniref:tRNA-specific adenosine deaminase 1 isoform X2 n=1 Tax=Acipenser ruthenus TaxID=7906 RepID=UPI00274255F0|nr:tRNA-specific adenosine deaminase 1 isoform X2 [Acipenser ruthenus]